MYITMESLRERLLLETKHTVFRNIDKIKISPSLLSLSLSLSHSPSLSPASPAHSDIPDTLSVPTPPEYIPASHINKNIEAGIPV